MRAGVAYVPGSRLVAQGYSMIGAEAGCRFVDQVPAYLSNLHRLGLIWFSREPVADRERYQVLEVQPDVVEALKRGRALLARRPPQHPLDAARRGLLRGRAAAWAGLEARHLAVLVLLPIGRSPLQQLQPRHAGDYTVGVEDRVTERIGRDRHAVLKARDGRCARPRALSDFSLRGACALAGLT